MVGISDPMTVGEWQLIQEGNEMPTYQQLELFSSKRAAAYEAGAQPCNVVDERSIRVKPVHNNKSFFTRSTDHKGLKCPVCSLSHKVYLCDSFNKISINERKAAAFKHRLCLNCLNSGHQLNKCLFPCCPKCGQRHN